MLELQAEIIDTSPLANASPRNLAPIMKSTLKFMAVYWHRKYIRKHFGDQAASRYSEAYAGWPDDDTPMEDTGSFKEHVTRRVTEATVTGTSKGVRLKMGLGRPGKYTDQQMVWKIISKLRRMYHMSEDEAYFEMKRKGPLYKDVARQMFRRHSYPAKVRKKFQQMLTAISDAEYRELLRVGTAHALKLLNTPTRPKRRRVRA